MARVLAAFLSLCEEVWPITAYSGGNRHFLWQDFGMFFHYIEDAHVQRAHDSSWNQEHKKCTN